MSDPIMVVLPFFGAAVVMFIARICERERDFRQALRLRCDAEKKILEVFVKKT